MIRSTVERILDGTAEATETAAKYTSRKLQSTADSMNDASVDENRRRVLKGAGAAGAAALGGTLLQDAATPDQGQELPYELHDGETKRFATNHMIGGGNYDGNLPLDTAEYTEVTANVAEDGDVDLTVDVVEQYPLTGEDGEQTMEESVYTAEETFEEGYGAMSLPHDDSDIQLVGRGSQVASGSGDYATESKVSLEFDWDGAPE